MKRKIVILTLIVALFAVMLFLIIFLSDTERFLSKSQKRQTENKWADCILYPIINGEIIHTYETEGEVVSNAPEIYIMDIIVKNINETDFSLIKNKGEDFSKDEAVYKYGTDAISMGFNGKVVDINIEEASGKRNAVIKMLNYDKLYVVTAIDPDKYSDIKYDMEVKVIYENQEIPAQIRTIGYEIEDGKIPVTVSLYKNILPGAQTKVLFTTGKQEKGMYVLREAVYQDGDDFYADIKVNDDIVRVEITVGQEFVDDSDEITRSYIEILSGVGPDDVLVAKRAGSGARDANEK